MAVYPALLLTTRLNIDAKKRRIPTSFDMGPKRRCHMPTRIDTRSWPTHHMKNMQQR